MESKADTRIVRREKLAENLYFFVLRSILDNSFKEEKFIEVIRKFLNVDERLSQQLCSLSVRQQRLRLLKAVKETAVEDIQYVATLIEQLEKQEVASEDEIALLKMHIFNV